MTTFRITVNYKIEETLQKVGFYTIVAGLFTMEFFHTLSSWGIILLSLLAIVNLVRKKSSLKGIFTSPYFTPFILIFFLLLLSYGMTKSENFDEIAFNIEKRSGLLALPLAMIVLPVLSPRFYKNLFLTFFVLVVFTAIYSTIHYFFHREAILLEYERSGIMFTPVNHIRYSLMVCYSIFIGLYLLPKEKKQMIQVKYLLLILMVAFLIFFLHLLAVRSGIISFYCVTFIAMIYFFVKRNFTYLLTLTVSLLLLITLSFQYIETLKAKWNYTLYDIYLSGDKDSVNNLSIAKRIIANKVAFTVFKDNLLVGTGEANLKAELDKVYKTEYSFIHPENYLDPHNQFLRVLAGIGIIGFVLYFSCFYYPLFYEKNYRHFLLTCIYVILTISFLVEDTLQTQLGMIFGLFFICTNLHLIKGSSQKNV